MSAQKTVIVSPRLSPPALTVLGPLALGLLGVAATGLWLLGFGPPGAASFLAPLHLFFVGGLLPIALAAGVQLSAATAARAHPRPRLLLAGLLVAPAGWLIALGFGLGRPPLLALGGLCALCGIVPVAWAIAEGAGAARPFLPLHLGLLLGALSFAAVCVLGTLLALARLGADPRLFTLLPWHVAAALGGGFLALLLGVFWQLFSMFAGTPLLPAALGYAESAGAALLALAGALLFALGAGVGRAALPLALWLSLFAAGAVWQLLHRRTLPRRELVPLGAPLAALQLAAAAWLCAADRPALALLLGGVGGIGLAVLSFLERIVPFLVFQVRLRRRSAGQRVMKLAEILPARAAPALLVLFEAGLCAWVLGAPLGARLLGLALFGFALRLLYSLRHLPRGRSGQPVAPAGPDH